MRDDKPDIVAELRDLLTDWNGADIPDASLPRIDVLCGTVRQAADEITRLRREVVVRNERLLSAERKHAVTYRALEELVNCNAKMTGDPDHDAAVWADADCFARMVLENGPATRADATNNPVPLALSDAGSDAEGRG